MVNGAHGQDALERAVRYLERNVQLRETLGIGPFATLNPQFLGQGEHNQNFWFSNPDTGQKFVLRINILPQPFHANQVAYEAAALRAVEASGCTPRVLYVDDSRELISDSVLVESFCEGRELDFDHLQPGDLQCAARIMAEIHAVPVAEDCPLFQPADGLRSLYEECVERYRVYFESAYEDARITRWTEQFLKAAAEVLDTPCSEADRNHIVNTETLPSHFLLPKELGIGLQESGHPGYFVDWERPIIGEVAQDLAFFTTPSVTFWDSDFLFPAEDVDGFLEEYWRAVDGRFSPGSFYERFRAWRMMSALRATTWCCKALIRYNSDDFQLKNQRTVEKLPIYLSDEFMEMQAKTCFGL